MNANNIFQGDCLEVMKQIPDNSADCCVTSPPYWSLRDYGVAGQLGLEPTFQEYIDKLCNIFDELKRVLKPEGTCWVNLGDTYANNGGMSNSAPDRAGGKAKGTRGTQPSAIAKGGYERPRSNLPDKSLCCIPDRFKIEMIDRGWICRNEIIWFKPNCMPSSVKDRFTVDYEKVFFFVKSKKYFFKTQYEPFVSNPHIDKGHRYQESDLKLMSKRDKMNFYTQQGRNKRCVWQVNTKPFKEAHFATYPEKLIEPMIDAGCPEFVCKKCGKGREIIYDTQQDIRDYRDGTHTKANIQGATGSKRVLGDNGWNLPQKNITMIGLTDCNCNAGFDGGIVLDPFFGAGTTGIVAMKQNKQYLGIELNSEYIEIAKQRIAKAELGIQNEIEYTQEK